MFTVLKDLVRLLSHEGVSIFFLQSEKSCREFQFMISIDIPDVKCYGSALKTKMINFFSYP